MYFTPGTPFKMTISYYGRPTRVVASIQTQRAPAHVAWDSPRKFDMRPLKVLDYMLIDEEQGYPVFVETAEEREAVTVQILSAWKAEQRRTA
jgi:hypothetical protein